MCKSSERCPINAISDIFGPGVPDASGVRQGYATIKSTVTTLRDTTGSYETGHAGSAGFCPGAADLEFALDKAYNDRVGLSDQLTAAVGNEKVRMDALKKELADQRTKDGAIQILEK